MTSRYSNFIKRTGVVLTLVLTLSTLTSCFKDFTDDFLFTDKMIEFDRATWESNAPGKTYPILGTLEKGSGVHTFQVNLIGGQLDADQTLQYRVVPDETTAMEGTHFALPDGGNFVIEANSSTGLVSIEILDFPAEAGMDTLVLELVGNEQVKVSENYKRIGVSISLMGPPSTGHPLHEQLGPENFYNSIYLDPLNPHLPTDVAQRIAQSAANLAAYADGSRRLQSLYVFFDADDLVHVTAQYYGGGGNSLTAGPTAIWTYKMVLDAEGVGKLEFLEANGNGSAQRENFYPILGDYLERHTFKVDWVDPALATPGRPAAQLGGFFRTDDPDSYIIGPLETLSASGNIRPFPSSPAMHELFTDGEDGYFSTLYIDPDAPEQSPAFRSRWQEGKAYIESLAGRQLHKMLFYFNPAFNFQDVQVVNYYYSSSGGRFLGQMRFRWQADGEGHIKPFDFIYENANGGAIRSPEVIDDFLMTTEFATNRTGDRIRFTSTTDPSVYFEGELGNHPINVGEFWP